MNLSDNIKKIRKNNNLSQEDLAEKLGVSRQSVSKWESGLAYPEMDKMLQLCKIFNLNIDELLNQDIKEVNSRKESKNNVNRFIDDFLGFITKTIDMFSALKFNSKLKCIVELLFITLLIFVFALIIGIIGNNIIHNLFSYLPDNIHYFLYNVLEAIYICVSLVFGIILIIHIFKVRYLDYYEIIKTENVKEEKDESDEKKLDEKRNEKNKNDKIYIEKKKEKIIVRDPKHSGYKFITSLLKGLLFIIKLLALFIGIIFCLSLITFCISLVISFMFVKSGLLFIGSLLLILSSININIIILIILYNFIMSKKSKRKVLALSFLASLILTGVSIGLISIGFTDFDIIENIDTKYFVKETKNIEMKDDLIIVNENYYEFEFIESNNTDIKFVSMHSPFSKFNLYENGNLIYVNAYMDEEDIFKSIRTYIDDFNNKKIVYYDNKSLKIYTTKENIEKLKHNKEDYLKVEIETQNIINEYETKINNYENKIIEYEEKVNDLENQINDKDIIISELEKEIINI